MNVEDIKRLIDLVAGSRVSVLELTVGETKLRIETAAAGASPASAQPLAAQPSAEPARPEEPQPAATAAAPPAAKAVRAPTDGLVHLRPSPDAPPFVAEGQVVAAGDTVCLIEVMKMFHAVAAGEAGTARAIRVRDGQHVDFDEVILELA